MTASVGIRTLFEARSINLLSSFIKKPSSGRSPRKFEERAEFNQKIHENIPVDIFYLERFLLNLAVASLTAAADPAVGGAGIGMKAAMLISWAAALLNRLAAAPDLGGGGML